MHSDIATMHYCIIPSLYIFTSIIINIIMYNAAEEIEGKSRANLGDILQFMTGLRQIPPLGFSKKIAVFFLEPSKVLPEVSACFYTLHLPVSVETKELFFERFDQAVLYSVNHFGQE